MKKTPVIMIRGDLELIPQFELPSDYQIRWYESGDEGTWRSIQTRADRYNDITSDLFRQSFGDDQRLLGERQCYLVDPNGVDIGTGTASVVFGMLNALALALLGSGLFFDIWKR